MDFFKYGLVVISAILCMAFPITSIAEDSVIAVDVADCLIQQGAGAYYQVYGVWPESWSAVVEAGLVQAPLTSMSGEPIDPDDGEFNGDGDLQYLPSEAGIPPNIARVIIDEGNSRVIMTPISPVKSYQERFAARESVDIQQALTDELRLKQWAIGGMLFEELNLFSWVYDTTPATFEEFIKAGVTCIDASSINPLTNDIFMGDGSPDDFLFFANIDEGTGEATAFSILATDADGGTPWKFTY